MRPIKFRVWNKTTKEIDYYQPFIYDLLIKNGKGMITLDNFPIMQFTGLLDKNKNPIYEGDILRRNNGTITDKFGIRPAYLYGDIVFINAGFELRNSQYDESDFDISCSEVIGNIHESPELLEAK